MIKTSVSLADFTSYRVGGRAQWYAEPVNLEELREVFAWLRSQDLPLTVLGAGSNLLISDRGLPGLVLNTRHLRSSCFDAETATITAAAGEPLPKIAWRAAKRGWRGLEWAVGIPGTVGGAVVMNAGAHTSCVADRLVRALVLNPDGQLETLSKEDLNYSYRSSSLQGDQRLVIEATFQLEATDNCEEIMAITTHNLRHRKSTQPYDRPSCGSVFRNPKPQFAGALIEGMGLKGYQIGGAQVSELHANFILNIGSAKASDILRLIRHVQEQVFDRWSLWLEPEVKVLGEFDGI
ncbi:MULTISPECIES: UDP-N-acetylmuramate dehydrogenase [unclassified Microcystis]|uniref:UDP-N-acetylmuramate dehydrogenase n=1 Tax=unclassified Microcystis TaxID=2643300 RepID=UPI0022C3EAC1|nr:UDP-N-acetylmuramate dehydrogenase [Microcystis sp. LE19-195.1E]MCZ8248684.1 UDP-N-acetylmuramate dehydrogenase [Microcystis sp. LE19-195.1E]